MAKAVNWAWGTKTLNAKVSPKANEVIGKCLTNNCGYLGLVKGKDGKVIMACTKKNANTPKVLKAGRTDRCEKKVVSYEMTGAE